MPTTADRLLRDFVRYHGDGQPNEPGPEHGLPRGDPASGVHEPDKKDFRDALNGVAGAADAANAAAGGANAAAAAANAAAAAILAQQPPLVVLAIGQSNMQGIGDQVGGDQTGNPRVFVWDNGYVAGGGVTSGTRWNVGAFGTRPLNVAGTGGGYANNLAYHFCKELQVRTGRSVYLFLIARHGHHIEAFLHPVDLSNNGWSRTDGEQAMFEHMVAQLDAGLPLVPGAPTTVDYVLIHQGEANREEQVEIYAAKLRMFVKRLEIRGNADMNYLNVIAGELFDGASSGRYRDRHASALRRLQMGTYDDSIPRFKIAAAHGLEAVTLADDIHFTGPDLVALGRRYCDAAFTEQPPEELDPTTCDLSVDGGLGWATNMTAGQAHVSYWRRQSAYLANTPLGIENNAVLGWCYTAPQSAATYIVSRKLFRVPVEAQFLIEIDVKNDHPSADLNFRLGVLEYNENKAYLAQTLMTNQVLAAGGRATHFATFGAPGGSRAATRDFNGNARWFAPSLQFNWGGVGATVRFNIRGMRWI
ncbi:sialate O-acetylesterase [Paracoccus litorisediminis]|uniref:sialate O-acetylesterase n=1 Tax=Paracoccus litorisediminis TaxID=2006130 RepID=UPI003731552C